MKTGLTGLLVLCISFAISAQQVKSSDPIAKNVNAKEFSLLMKEKPGLLLDVRTQGEIDKGAISGYKHLDFFADNFSSELDKFDKSKPVYVYCASGGRSGEAMEMMQKKGFKEVYNLEGGYNSWKKTFSNN